MPSLFDAESLPFLVLPPVRLWATYLRTEGAQLTSFLMLHNTFICFEFAALLKPFLLLNLQALLLCGALAPIVCATAAQLLRTPQ